MDNIELKHRLTFDFTLTYDEVFSNLKKYDSSITKQNMEEWLTKGYLESMIIDGEILFFRASVRNVLRLDKHMHSNKRKLDGTVFPDKTVFLKKLLPKLIQKDIFFTFEMYYDLVVKESVMLEKESSNFYVWLPYPKVHVEKQPKVELLKCSNDNPFFSNSNDLSSSLYCELKDTNKVSEQVRFVTKSSFSEFLRFEVDLPKDIDFHLYLKEQLPHIVTDARVQKLAQSIVGDTLIIYDKAKLLFDWVSDNLVWASAREYGTLECIPEYVLNVMHGDCGQVTLLYISLCRSLGIPARWQSGFMLHTAYENLHDWCEIYLPGAGWRSVDVSFGRQDWSDDPFIKYFYFGNYDGYRCIVNSASNTELNPNKHFDRSDPVDFQRGEIESNDSNFYYNKWNWNFKFELLNESSL